MGFQSNRQNCVKNKFNVYSNTSNVIATSDIYKEIYIYVVIRGIAFKILKAKLLFVRWLELDHIL